MFRLAAVATLIGLTLVSQAAEAATARFGKGTVELYPSVAYRFKDDSNPGTSRMFNLSSVAGYVGYFVSDRIELGAALLAQKDFNADETRAGVTAGATINSTLAEDVAPYLRGSLGVVAGSEPEGSTLILPQIEGGLRMRIGRATSLTFSFSFQHYENTGALDLSKNAWTLGGGVSFFPVLGKK
jgi:hypothetical protein